MTVFVVPGSLDTATGGFRYDRRIVAEWRRAGQAVDVVELPGRWPRPDAADRARAEARFAAIADGELVVVDGLALGASPELAARQGARLRLVALVHHPLWMEDDPAAGGVPRPPPDTPIAAAEIAALAHARRVVVTSAATAAAVARMGVAPERIDVVEPGCDPFPVAAGTRDGPLRLLCVATVTPRKGLLDLVAALALAEAKGVGRRGWRLDVVGSIDRDPAHVAAVRAAIADAGLGDRIALAGEVEEAALPRWYAGADGFVLASRHEGYGMSLAEALMHGLPVVATAAGAIVDTVAGAACLVRVGDVAALATAIAARLFDDAGRAAQAAASRRWRSERLASAGWPAAARRFADAIADA